MIVENGVRWDGMARIQRWTLPEKNRKQLDRALASLVGRPPDQWPAQRVVRVREAPPLYLLRLPEGFRAFIAPVENNEIEVQIVTNQASIDQFRENGAREGVRG